MKRPDSSEIRPQKRPSISDDKKACNPVCDILLKAGVPHDLKWLCLLNFLRTLEKDDLYNTEQKRVFHALLQDIVKKADFTDPYYEEVETEVERIRHMMCKEREDYLSQKLKEAEANFQDTKSMLGTVLKNYVALTALGAQLTNEKVEDIEKLKDVTVTAIEKGDDPKSIIDEVVTVTASMVEKMNREIADWRQKAHESEAWKQRAFEMERLATIDALTSLYNRRAFDLHIESMVQVMLGKETFLSIMMIDIDHFKAFNDTYGHDVGDEVLRLVASIIKKNANREGDFVARYGGEEIVMLSEGMDIEQARLLAEKIRGDIESYRFIIKKDPPEEKNITVSIGVSELDCCKVKGGDISFLIQRFIHSADTALYKAKREGRNRVCVFSNTG